MLLLTSICGVDQGFLPILQDPDDAVFDLLVCFLVVGHEDVIFQGAAFCPSFLFREAGIGILELLVFLTDQKPLPYGYKPLFDCLSKYQDPIRDVESYRNLQKEQEKLYPPEERKKINKGFMRVLERHRKKALSKEHIYNMVCDENPQASYKQIHKYLREAGTSAATLRQCKKRRIESTDDFRGEVSSKDVGVIRKALVSNEYALPPERLFRLSGLERSRFQVIVKQLMSEGKIVPTKKRMDGNLRKVLVWRLD